MELVPLVLLAVAVAIVSVAAARLVRLGATRGADASLAEDPDAALLGRLAERREIIMQLMLSTTLDFEMGKITADDRDKTLERLKREGVAVAKRMQSLAGSDDDLAAVDRDLKSAALETDANEAWSPVALARHGGAAPSTVEAS